VVNAYHGQHAASAGDVEQTALAALYGTPSEARASVARLVSMVRRGTISEAEADKDIALARAEEAAADADIAAAAARSAHTAMLNRVWREMFERAASLPERESGVWRPAATLAKSMGGDVAGAFEVALGDEQRAELRAAFDELDLEQQRTLVRSLLRVSVLPGRGTGRVDIEPVGQLA
jgi:hypothetical protein